MAFHNFDPKQHIVTFAGIIVRGYADGTNIQASRNTDTYSESVGAHGDVVRVRSHDKTGVVTLTLQDASPTNDAFSNRLRLDELTPGGIAAGPLLIKNLNGTTVISCENAWLKKPADFEASTDPSSREWMIGCAELEMFIGGAIA